MKITVIGAAGCVGSCTSFTIAVLGLADEIIMIDDHQQSLLGQHASDIGPAVANQDIIIRAGSYEDMPGSDIIINAAGLHQGLYASAQEWLTRSLSLIQEIARKIAQFCPQAVVITAANPVGPLNYATYLLSSHRNRSQYLGYSFNDTIRFRIMLAQALGVKTSQVEGTAIGDHGPTQVLLFSSVRVKSKPFPVSEDVKQKILRQVPDIFRNLGKLKEETGRTAGWTTAAGLAAVSRAIGKDTGEMLPCSAVLEGEYGCRGLSIGVPAIIGREGIRKVLEWQLAPDEHENLEHSINTLKPSMRYVEEYLGTG
jgi:malate dehydrogenase